MLFGYFLRLLSCRRWGLILCALFAVVQGIGNGGPARAQHCPPIEESYLSAISLRRAAGGKTLDLEIEYRKLGRLHEAYQVYLLAFWSRDTERFLNPPQGEAFDPEACVILETRLLKPNSADGNSLIDAHGYRCAMSIDTQELAETMLAFGKMTDDDRHIVGGWGWYQETIQFAVFIPFLEDAKYATLKDLPEDRHECNYGNAPALLFAVMPHQLQIKFGVVSAFRTDEGSYRIHINTGKSPGVWKR